MSQEAQGGGTPSAGHAPDAQPGSENSPQGDPVTVAGTGAAERAEPGAPPPGSNQRDPAASSGNGSVDAATAGSEPEDVRPAPVPAPGVPGAGTPGSAAQVPATPPSSTTRAAGSPGHPAIATRSSAPDGEVGAT